MGTWINTYGNLFSFLGLLLSGLTFIGVLWNKKILNKLNKKNFKLNRMPENLQDLKNISDNISNLLADFENEKLEIKRELSKIPPILKSLEKSLNGDDLENVDKVKRSIKYIDKWQFDEEKKMKWYKDIFKRKKQMTEDVVTEVDIKLTRLITDIENIDKDNKKNLIA